MMLPDQLHFTKTRIAPTPSGYLHLGNVLSFALTAALACKTGAKILLRIDDLDQERVNSEYVQDIFDTLNFLDIPWDEGPRNADDYQQNWSQLQRMKHYQNALQQLADKQEVFACTCTRMQLQGQDGYPGTCRNKPLPLKTPQAAWRLYTDTRHTLTIETLTNGSVSAHLPNAMKDFVVKKKDNYPAYQLASVIDDMHFGIDLVVRGQDLYPSTLAQHYLAEVLGLNEFKNVTFHHHQLVMDDEQKKLSKSAGATSIKYLREQGKTAADVYALIGKLLGYTTRLTGLADFKTLL
jgi:glutamyl/glutaminyl-tRNA synthetase